jgi:hypothetical protein
MRFDLRVVERMRLWPTSRACGGGDLEGRPLVLGGGQHGRPPSRSRDTEGHRMAR